MENKRDIENSRPLKRLRKTLTIDNLWLYILSILKTKDTHAYNLFKEMHKKYGIKPGLVTPYVVLYKLEEDGYIASYTDGRKRNYRITERGREILKMAKEEIKSVIKKI